MDDQQNYTPTPTPETPQTPQQVTPPVNNVYNAPNGVVTSGGGVPGKKGVSRGRLFAITGAAALVVLGTGGYVLGFYVPNKPANVFKSALENTGKGYDSLVDYASNKDLAKKLDKSATTGDFKVESDSFSTDGTFKVNTDNGNASFSGDVGLGTTRLKIDGIVKDVATSDSPDAYLKFSGIKGFGSSFGMPELDTLDSQWVTVDHSLIDTIAKQSQKGAGLDATSVEPPTAADVTEAAKVLGDTSDKYVFTTDPANAVLTMDKYVGAETVDGKATKHYKVKADKENLKKFAKELGTNLDKTKLNDWAKKTYDKPLSEVIDVDQMVKSADDIKSGDTFDLWVNTKTKMVHKVRFSDKENASKNYFDLGLNYNGGDEKPFFINAVSSKDGTDTNGSLTFTLNTKTNEVKAAFVIDTKADGASTKATMNLVAKPTTEAVDVNAPAGAITLSEALDKVGLGSYLDLLMSSMEQMDQSALSSDDMSQFTMTQ